jgi:hypothetical protein
LYPPSKGGEKDNQTFPPPKGGEKKPNISSSKGGEKKPNISPSGGGLRGIKVICTFQNKNRLYPPLNGEKKITKHFLLQRGGRKNQIFPPPEGDKGGGQLLPLPP